MKLSKHSHSIDVSIYTMLIVSISAIALHQTTSIATWVLFCVAGITIWTFLEYILHKYLLHCIPPFKQMHELHHVNPTALIGTPTWLSLSIFTSLAMLLWRFIGVDTTSALLAGLMLGYICYVIVHNRVHRVKPVIGSWLYRTKLRHAKHHHLHTRCNYKFLG